MTEKELREAAEEYDRLEKDDLQKQDVLDSLLNTLRKTGQLSRFVLIYHKVPGDDRRREVWVCWANGRQQYLDVSGQSALDMITNVVNFVKESAGIKTTR